MFRVMKKIVDDYGNESFTKYGPLRKSYESAVAAADRSSGYVVEIESGRRVYMARDCLDVKPLGRAKRDRAAFNFAQVFQVA